ncbi:PucR family transcriptional regulator [Pseudonocardia phyllosphaerae]|uniref:PucR family transcriptional regulator n=1 Tax=Pseudonocardia phyllosphaerae TaxID=3390502 RepID=UPI00397B5601
MRLSELVERPELRLRVLHGDAQQLDRPVRWVYTTDLPDPSQYLGGGELVVSGMVWRRSAADTERFVAALARAEVAALAAGEALHGEVPGDVVAACRRHDVVLLAVPTDVSFSQLTEVVVGALSAARGDRLAHTLGRHRRLLDALAGGAGLDELTATVSAGTGLVCRVLTAGGRPIAGPPQDPAERDAVVTAFLTAERLPATAAGHVLLPVGPGTSRVTGWLAAAAVGGAGPGNTAGGAGTGDTADAACPGDTAGPGDATGTAGMAGTGDTDGTAGTEPGTDVLGALGELAAIAALDRARRREGTAVTRPIAEDALARIAAGAGDRTETRVRLRQAGAEPDGTPTVVVLAVQGGPDPAGTAYELLADAVPGPAAVGLLDGSAVAVLPGADDAEATVAALQRLGPGLGPRRLHAGVSRPSGASALSGALGEARHAAGVAATRPGPVAVARAGEVTSHVALLAGVPDDVRRAFSEQVLGPVLEHDARSGTGLRETLEVFLDESGSWSRTAARLHLHVNTVRYRIGRVEELTGRDLGRFTDRVDLHLALQLRR